MPGDEGYAIVRADEADDVYAGSDVPGDSGSSSTGWRLGQPP
jgi:hypothetical protein